MYIFSQKLISLSSGVLLSLNNSMGDNPSKPQQPTAKQTSNAQSSSSPVPDSQPDFQLEPGRPNISYYWIDRRVYNAQNQMCFNYFRKQFRMEIFTSIDGLRYALDQGDQTHMVKVLTAAGLPDEDFRYLHNEPKVAEVFLYCANEERAKLLMRNFSKIADFGLRKQQVAEKMRAAESRPPKKTTPITEDLIGKRVQGINSGTNSSEKQQQVTAVATNVSSNNTVNVNNSLVGVSLQPGVGNVNQSSVNVNMSAVNINMNPPVNVNQSSVVVNMSPVNVNQSTVNVNQSTVNVNLQPPKPVNINNSTVDVVL